MSAMSWVDSSVVSSSALRVLAISAESIVFLSSRSRRNFSLVLLGHPRGLGRCRRHSWVSFSRAPLHEHRGSFLDPEMITDSGQKSSRFRAFNGPLTACPLSPLPQELARDAQPLGRERPISARPAQCLVDVRIGELLQRPAVLGRRGRAATRARRALRSEDPPAPISAASAVRTAFSTTCSELADVARPRVAQERLLRLRREPPRRAARTTRAARFRNSRASGRMSSRRSARRGSRTETTSIR